MMYTDENSINLFFELYKLDTTLSMDKKITYLKSHMVYGFRYFCFYHLDNIRKLELKDFPLNSNYETVLIEYRILPHVEFLIRNMIDKLDNSWSHTVICGNLNYNFMKEICNKINPKIKVIQTNFDNLSRYEYSNYLCTIDFWNLLNGEKILLYQEDSCIFKKNISDYLCFDWIGASNCAGGNGGFSLRTRQKMIEVIQYNNLKYYFPEDVYFSKTIHDNNLGRTGNDKEGFEFSTENHYNPNSLGGHQFWNCDKNWENRMIKIIEDMNII